MFYTEVLKLLIKDSESKPGDKMYVNAYPFHYCLDKRIVVFAINRLTPFPTNTVPIPKCSQCEFRCGEYCTGYNISEVFS